MTEFYFISLNYMPTQEKLPILPFCSTEMMLSSDEYYANLQVSHQFIFQFPVHWDTLSVSISLLSD